MSDSKWYPDTFFWATMRKIWLFFYLKNCSVLAIYFFVFFRENPQTKTTTFWGKKTGYLHHFCLVKGLEDTVVNCWHAPPLGGV